MPNSFARPVLVIGTKKYSTWSMRPWVALRAGGIDFEEVLITLRQPGTAAEIIKHNPTGMVPALKLGAVTIADSLAICEWAAEQAPSLLPGDSLTRAQCRSAASEMHSGFGALRRECPMDIGGYFPDHVFSAPALAEIARIEALWTACREAFGQHGPYLFGGFTLADAMFAPVVMRFVSYAPTLSATTQAYVETMLAEPATAAWITDAV